MYMYILYMTMFRLYFSVLSPLCLSGPIIGKYMKNIYLVSVHTIRIWFIVIFIVKLLQVANETGRGYLKKRTKICGKSLFNTPPPSAIESIFPDFIIPLLGLISILTLSFPVLIFSILPKFAAKIVVLNDLGV